MNPEDIDKMVSVKGFVVRVSQPIPELKEGFYRCANCNSTATAVVEDGHIKEPDVCENPDCGQPSMEVVHSRCTFYNKQLIRLQEVPDSVPAGQTPHTVSLVAYDELVDATKPGDRVEITGIFKAMPMRVNPRQRITRSIFKTYVDVLHIKSTEKKRIGETVLGDLGNEESQIE